MQVLAVMQRTGKPLSELVRGMARLPQVLLNVRLREPADPSGDESIVDCVRAVEAELGARGRVVLRASGTEPVIRVMVEGEDSQQVSQLATKLADSVRDRLGLPS